MSLRRQIKKWGKVLALAITLQGSPQVSAQALSATLVETSKVTDFGLEFDEFRFGSRITPHGDCVDVINGYLFVTWYRGGMDDRHVMLSRKKIGSGSWKTIEFPHQHVGFRGDPTVGDSHNTIAVAVCPIDNTIHLLYDMHAYNPSELPNDYFNYSVSVPDAAFVPDDQFTAALFLPKQNHLEPTGNYIDVTYPKFVRADDGSIMANWRNGGAGSGNSFYSRYDGSAWSPPIMFGNGTSSVPSNRWSIYGKLKYEGGNLGYGFSIRWGGARNDDIPFNSGFYYAEARPPYGAGDWYDADGNPITLPISNPEVIKVGEPTDLGLGKRITGGADWTRTQNGALHFMTVVDGNFVHHYRPAGSSSFITDLNAPLSDMYPAGDYVLMADSAGGRPLIRIAPEGTSNWQQLYRETSGPSMDYYNVDLEGDTLVYYSRSPGGTTSEPLHVTVYQLDIPGIENPDYNPEPTNGPIAHWPLDEGAGAVTANTASPNDTATLENGAGWGSDAERASYVTFNGTDQRIATNFRYALSATDDFTWAWWANKQSPAGADDAAIMVGNRYGGSGSESLEFIKFMPAKATFVNGGLDDREDYQYEAITNDGWHHYTMVKSGTSYQWYVDGVKQGDEVSLTYSETHSLPFLIGGDGDNKPNEHFQGFIDDVVLYRRALTPVDVVSLKNGVYLSHAAPTISDLADQAILANTAIGPLPLSVEDDFTSPDSITLTASSSHPDLVPQANIVFGGSASNRTVTITPRSNQSGSAAISLSANDGSLTTTTTFTLTVMPPGTVFNTVTFDSAGTTSWLCPPGVTSIEVECWGGGGAGGSSSTTGAPQVYLSGGGGAGGSYAKRASVPVTPGNSYSVTIAPAAMPLSPATASTEERANGADISFAGDHGVTVLAKGGEGGQCVINPSATQSGLSGIGLSEGNLSDGTGFFFLGGSGHSPVTKGGSGGGGAGRSEDGGAASLADPTDEDSVSLPGMGGNQGGGDGGQGANFVGNGGHGMSPGGGGGGARTGRWTDTSNVPADRQKLGGSGGLGQITISYFEFPTPNTHLEDWRMAHFATTENTGTAADNFDANSDGESNLLEFATAQNPHAATLLSTPLEMNGNIVEYRYPRSAEALADGMTYQVEWSDTLQENSWSTLGVIDSLDTANPGTSELENRLATVPQGSTGKRFLRLKVAQP